MRLLLALMFIAYVGNVKAQSLESKDGKFSLVIPPGWQQFSPDNPNLEGGVMLRDNYPLTVFLTKEKQPLDKVIEELKKELGNISTGSFKTVRGLVATTVVTERALEQPNSYVYQYYFLFGSGRTTYALICTSGVAQKGQGPKVAFEALVQTAQLK